MVVAQNKIVFINYSIKDGNGEIIEDNHGYAPEVYFQGGNNILPVIEKKLEGKNIGETIELVCSPMEAYGIKDEKLIKDCAFDLFEELAEVKVGDFASLKDGNEVFILKKNTNSYLVDFNHPLAGKTLHFSILISDIRNASKEELFEQKPILQPKNCGPTGCC